LNNSAIRGGAKGPFLADCVAKVGSAPTRMHRLMVKVRDENLSLRSVVLPWDRQC